VTDRRLALLPLLAVLLGGCGGLPTSSAVRIERTVAASTGFLDAQAADQDDYAIARTFLVSDDSWITAGTVSVYSAATTTATTQTATTATVEVTLTRTASLDTVGSYTPRADETRIPLTLRRVRGQWRIANPPAGLLLTGGDLQRSYTPSTLWWYAPDYAVLVPEQRWLPSVGDGRQTQLVRALLDGPGAALAPAVRTAVPAGVTLEGSVSQDGSDAVVDLSQGAASLDAPQAERLLVQLASTLQQAPAGTAVRLEVDGQPLPTADAPQRLLLSDVGSADPDAVAPGAPALALTACPDCTVVAVPTAAGGSAPGLPAPAVALDGRPLTVAVPSPDARQVAAVEQDGRRQQLLLSGPHGVRVVATGSFGTPSWSGDDELAVPTRTGLVLIATTGVIRTVAYPPTVGTVTSARLARDGLRVLVSTTGGAADVLAIVPGPVTSLALVGRVSTGLGTVSGAVWTSSATLAMLVSGAAGGPQLAQISVDGSLVETTPLPTYVGTAPTLAGATGVPLLLSGAGIVAVLAAGEVWRPVLHAAAVAAPG
jgi:hypothetical protein